MKLTPGREPRVRGAKASETVQRPPELSPYAEALSLIPAIREKIRKDFKNPNTWFPMSLSAWCDVKWLDPSFDLPEISSDQIKEKLFTYIEEAEKRLGEAKDEAKAFESTCWMLDHASKCVTIRPELRTDIIQRVQPHIDTVLNRLEQLEYATDFESKVDQTGILMHLQTFGPEVSQKVKLLVKKFESPALAVLKRLAEQEVLTPDEQAQLLVGAVLFRLILPQRQTEIQSIALPKVGDFDELSTDASNRFVVLLFRLLLHSPKVTLLPDGTLDMTLPPEAATPPKPLPDRPAV